MSIREDNDKAKSKLFKIDRIIELKKIENEAKKERYELENELGL